MIRTIFYRRRGYNHYIVYTDTYETFAIAYSKIRLLAFIKAFFKYLKKKYEDS